MCTIGKYQEWSVNDAYIITPNGDKILSYFNNPLYLVAHSAPIRATMPLEQLKKYLHIHDDLPDAIPYVTSYYKKSWGFCISRNQLRRLPTGDYHIVVDTNLNSGYLNFGELYIPGLSPKEILVSTYICHPVMANNESSGSVVAMELAKYYSAQKNKYSMRFVFVPETIGSITFISKNLKHLKNNCIAGFNITCVGDDLKYSFLGSKNGNTLADRAAQFAYKFHRVKPDTYNWRDRGSDERQYCWPGVDLPVVSMMRSKYNTYPEYHSSKDDMNFICESGLRKSIDMHIHSAINFLQSIIMPISKTICEPKLDKRNMYRTNTVNGTKASSNDYLLFLSYCDGATELNEVAKKCNFGVAYAKEIYNELHKVGLVLQE